MIAYGLERYTQQEIDKLKKVKPDMVVLGDILCNKKMFPYSGNEILEIITELKNSGVRVIYQTPMYATDRIFTDIVDKISYYHKRSLVEAVIVQDVGVAHALSRINKGLELIWGRMGYARTPVTNFSTLDFYKKNGIDSFECRNVQEANIILRLKMKPYLMIGIPSYTTINRECYYKYEHDIYDDCCDCGCLKKEPLVIPASKKIETTIDGYMLGYKNVYLQESIDKANNYENIIIYAHNTEDATSYMREILGR